jgi:hypothetical protein
MLLAKPERPKSVQMILNNDVLTITQAGKYRRPTKMSFPKMRPLSMKKVCRTKCPCISMKCMNPKNGDFAAHY